MQKYSSYWPNAEKNGVQVLLWAPSEQIWGQGMSTSSLFGRWLMETGLSSGTRGREEKGDNKGCS